MILLTSPTDQLQLLTVTPAPALDVHATWVDTVTATGAITPGRTNRVLAVGDTLTSIAGSPAASTQRNVKTVHIRNKTSTPSGAVTVQHTDGTVLVPLYSLILDPGSMLQYTDQGGFKVLPAV